MLAGNLPMGYRRKEKLSPLDHANRNITQIFHHGIPFLAAENMKSSANSIPRRDCIYLSYCRPPTPLLLHYMRLPFDLFPLISSLRSFRSPCPHFFFLFIPLLHSVRQVIRVEVPARIKVTVGRRPPTSMAVNIASAILYAFLSTCFLTPRPFGYA